MDPIRIEQSGRGGAVRESKSFADRPGCADTLLQPIVASVQHLARLRDACRILLRVVSERLSDNSLHGRGDIVVEYVGEHSRLERCVALGRNHWRCLANAVKILDYSIALDDLAGPIDQAGHLTGR